MKPEKLALDGDQIIMLYVYICARAQLHNIKAHLHFCKEFSTPFMKTTRMGYCLTTLEVALTLLVEEEGLISPLKTEAEQESEEDHFAKMQREFRKSITERVSFSLQKRNTDKSFTLNIQSNALNELAHLDEAIENHRRQSINRSMHRMSLHNTSQIRYAVAGKILSPDGRA